jgi:cytochrome c5
MKRAAVCFACHGADGVSKLPGVPHLAGQRSDYLEKALHDYRAGINRLDPTMTAMAKPLSDADIANIAAYYSQQVLGADSQAVAQVLQTQSRIAPAGVVRVAAAAATVPVAAVPSEPPAPRSGEAVYAAACAACHATGAAGAPKIGDSAVWAPRLAQGKAQLETHALQGFKAMPPKGGCVQCSDEEVRAAVAYMIAARESS